MRRTRIAPKAVPASAPMAPSSPTSPRNILKISPSPAPIARASPISDSRSTTIDISMVTRQRPDRTRTTRVRRSIMRSSRPRSAPSVRAMARTGRASTPGSAAAIRAAALSTARGPPSTDTAANDMRPSWPVSSCRTGSGTKICSSSASPVETTPATRSAASAGAPRWATSPGFRSARAARDTPRTQERVSADAVTPGSSVRQAGYRRRSRAKSAPTSVAAWSATLPAARRTGATTTPSPRRPITRPATASSRPAPRPEPPAAREADPAAGRIRRFGPYERSSRDIFSRSPAFRLRTVAITVAPTVMESRARRNAGPRRFRERRRKRADVTQRAGSACSPARGRPGLRLEATQHLGRAEGQDAARRDDEPADGDHESHGDRQRKSERTDGHGYAEDRGGDEARHQPAAHRPQKTARQPQDHRLRQEQADDARVSGPHRLQETDLRASLQDTRRQGAGHRQGRCRGRQKRDDRHQARDAVEDDPFRFGDASDDARLGARHGT